ncbi:uncharacterized protein LOC124255081 [Haliotis rubra]|uniref:uncharacterized protein LOC124255081 n=1 Tax=Haliotis rubra TaxID=36100 RepID=UPI001EE60B49|nr:uncharacterized protein LOC124255081 [Haliotis rubra]
MAGFRIRNFVLPPNLLRLIEVLLSVVAVCLVTGWRSEGFSYNDLNRSDFNVLHNLQYFVGMSTLTFLAVAVLCLIVLIKPVYLSSLVDMILNAVLSVLLFIAAIVLCVSITRLGESAAVKEADLTFSSLEGAVALGFICALALGGSGWFALQTHRRRSDLPLNQSHTNADLPGDIPT